MEAHESTQGMKAERPHPPPTWQGMALFAVVLALAMSGLGVQALNGSQRATDARACQPDPSAEIAALPPGGTFVGSGCYLVPNGILLTKPVTLDGGTYVDPSATKLARSPIAPVIQVSATSDVVLEHLVVEGGDPSGRYVQALVGQAGIVLKNTARVTIRDVSISGTFGDGLELWTHALRDMTPNTDLTVDGLTVTAAGRNGITPADVSGATFTGVHVLSWGLTAVDFESDMAGIGAGDVTFTDSSWGGTFIQEAITGPIRFDRCTLANKIQVTARNPVAFPVTFNDGSLAIGTKSNNIGVVVQGPVAVTFSGETFTRPLRPSGRPQTTRMWSVTGGGQLTFSGSTLAPPLGTADADSTVTVTP
jgi:hypothetical protein